MLKFGIYDFFICRGGTDMCFVLGVRAETSGSKTVPHIGPYISLPFCFYFCVRYEKYQKYLLLLWGPMKTPSCVTSLVTTTVTLSALLLLHLPLQHLLMKLNLLCLILL